jgi:hypothetical protein
MCAADFLSLALPLIFVGLFLYALFSEQYFDTKRWKMVCCCEQPVYFRLCASTALMLAVSIPLFNWGPPLSTLQNSTNPLLSSIFSNARVATIAWLILFAPLSLLVFESLLRMKRFVLAENRILPTDVQGAVLRNDFDAAYKKLVLYKEDPRFNHYHRILRKIKADSENI